MLDRIESLERRCRLLIVGLMLSLCPWIIAAAPSALDTIKAKRLILTEGLEIQDGQHRQAVFIDKWGMTIGRKDGVHSIIDSRAIVIGKPENGSPKVIAAIGSSQDAGFVLLQATDQDGSIDRTGRPAFK